MGGKLDNLPKKLMEEPLVDAVFEIRFHESKSIAVADILPGSIYKGLQGEVTSERLSVADIPKPIRDSDPNFRYSPVVRLHSEQIGIAIGDRSLVINCKLPYTGWEQFKLNITRIIKVVKKLDVIGSVERYSIKYINLIQAREISEQIKRIRMDIKIGNDIISDEHMSLRVEQREDDILHIIQIVTGAQVNISDGATLFGVIVDVDSIRVVNNVQIIEFAENLPDNLETLKQSNKRKIFACLTEEAINERGPIYE